MDLINREIALIDRENAFLLFATFCGDIERTAGALNISGAAVLKMAEDDGWLRKLSGIIELRKSNKPGDVERAINRALNFVQAHRFRLFVERVIKKITGFTDEQLEQYLMTGNAGPVVIKKLSTRALADLASAMEKAQAMSYLALNDTAQERIKRNETDNGDTAGGELHLQIQRAFAEVRASNSPRAQLFDAQLAIAADKAAVAHKEPQTLDDTYEPEG
jgi:hypothetical protein